MGHKYKIVNIDQARLSENDQRVFMQFAIAKKQGDYFVNKTPLVVCRDYFSDVIYIQHNELEDFPEVYGFKWKYQSWLSRQINNNKYTDMFIVVGGGYYAKVVCNINLLMRVEKYLGFSQTMYKEITPVPYKGMISSNKIFLHVRVPTEWWGNSLLISLYTFLWRLSAHDVTLSPLDSLDETFTYLMSAIAGSDLGILKSLTYTKGSFQFFLDNWKSIIGKNGQPMDIEEYTEHANEGGWSPYKYAIHNGSGIQSFFNGIRRPSVSEPAIREWCTKFAEEFSNVN